MKSFFVNHEHCPHGWIWSEETSKCFKAFGQKKRWSHALQTCVAGGGNLAVASSNSTLANIIEAMNLDQEQGEYWINARKSVDGNGYVWGDNSSVSSHNWAPEFPSQGE